MIPPQFQYLARPSEPVIVVGVMTVGRNGDWIQKRPCGLGVRGDLENGEQRYFDSLGTLLQFHPEIKEFLPKGDSLDVVLLR